MENLKWDAIKQNVNCFAITKRNDMYVVHQLARVPQHHFKDCTMQIPDEHIDWFLDELEKRKQEKREHKKQYYLEHKDKILRYNKEYRVKN